MESLEAKPRLLIKEARLLGASLGFPQAIWVSLSESFTSTQNRYDVPRYGVPGATMYSTEESNQNIPSPVGVAMDTNKYNTRRTPNELDPAEKLFDGASYPRQFPINGQRRVPEKVPRTSRHRVYHRLNITFNINTTIITHVITSLH